MAKQTDFIAPSILAADFARLGEECDAVLAAGASRESARAPSRRPRGSQKVPET